MTICTRCAVSEWHPEARTCDFGDCPFRAELPAIGDGKAAGRTGGREAGHAPVRHLYSSRRRSCAASAT